MLLSFSITFRSIDCSVYHFVFLFETNQQKRQAIAQNQRGIGEPDGRTKTTKRTTISK